MKSVAVSLSLPLNGSTEGACACSAAGGGFKGAGLTDVKEMLVKNVMRGARLVVQ